MPIDREAMDAAIVAALGYRPDVNACIAGDEDRAIYRAGYLAGMRASAGIAAGHALEDVGDDELACQGCGEMIEERILAAADKLEAEK